MDRLLRQITELGATDWIPFESSYSIPHWDKERLQKRKRRWEKITTEALKQCRRNQTVKIHHLTRFDKLVQEAENYDLKILFYEKASTLRDLLGRSANRAVKKILLVLGPEGGFHPQEVELAKASGFQIVSLGPRILKAETAGVVSCALIQFLFGDIGKIT
jgi:16S rRNA (uracil1498-N3)-methyltransferase